MNLTADKAWDANKIHYVLKETNTEIMPDIEWTTLKVRYEQELEARYVRAFQTLMDSGVQKELERWINNEDLEMSYCFNRVIEHYPDELKEICNSLRVPYDSTRMQNAFKLLYNKTILHMIRGLIEGKE